MTVKHLYLEFKVILGNKKQIKDAIAADDDDGSMLSDLMMMIVQEKEKDYLKVMCKQVILNDYEIYHQINIDNG